MPWFVPYRSLLCNKIQLHGCSMCCLCNKCQLYGCCVCCLYISDVTTQHTPASPGELLTTHHPAIQSHHHHYHLHYHHNLHFHHHHHIHHKGLFTIYVSQKWADTDPPTPLSTKNHKLAYLPPPLVIKNQKSYFVNLQLSK